jgi:ATP-dependent Clp protease ATP-binding subunit ClpA
MFERFSTPARDVVVRARQEAQDLRHPRIGTEHLLLALLDERAGAAYTVLREAGMDRERVLRDIHRLVGTPSKILSADDATALKSIGIDLDAVLARIEESFGSGVLDVPRPPTRRGLFGRKQEDDPSGFSPKAKKDIALALRETIRLGSNHIGPEHLLLGILRGDGLAVQILTEAGLSVDALRRATVNSLDEAA